MLAVVATRAGGPDVLEVAEVETPRPSAGEVLVKVAAAGVNRADLLQRRGHYPPPPGASPIIGLECSGEVVEVGEGVRGWEVGDACVALLAGGGYAEFVAAPAGQVIEPPSGLDRTTAAGLVEVAATVASNMGEAKLAAGDYFLVHGGSGGIGSFAIQYAKARGALVVATAGTEDKLEYCRSIGADLAVSYRGDWTDAVRDFCSGHGLDVILDSMGAKYLQPHLELLATGGRLVVIGLQGGAKGELDLARLLAKRGRIIATTLRARPVAEKAEICELVVASAWPLITTGAIVPAPQTVLPLHQAAEAHRLLESGENLGKIILTTP